MTATWRQAVCPEADPEVADLIYRLTAQGLSEMEVWEKAEALARRKGMAENEGSPLYVDLGGYGTLGTCWVLGKFVAERGAYPFKVFVAVKLECLDCGHMFGKGWVNQERQCLCIAGFYTRLDRCRLAAKGVDDG